LAVKGININIAADCKQQPMLLEATLAIELALYHDGSIYVVREGKEMEIILDNGAASLRSRH
jgi:hypothetical protein